MWFWKKDYKTMVSNDMEGHTFNLFMQAKAYPVYEKHEFTNQGILYKISSTLIPHTPTALDSLSSLDLIIKKNK